MPETAPVTQPDLTLRPLRITCERVMAEPPHVLFPAWTTDLIGSWMAVSSTVLMKLEVNAPFFFETQFDGQRHSDYGRCFRLEADRLVQMTLGQCRRNQGCRNGCNDRTRSKWKRNAIAAQSCGVLGRGVQEAPR